MGNTDLKSIILILAFAGSVSAADLDSLIDAIHQVETGGRHGAILGDGGRSLGPLQITRAYWRDSRVAGRYQDCASLDYSKQVFRAYMRRFAPRADWQTMARIHNGGPRGHRKAATRKYWLRVQKSLKN